MADSPQSVGDAVEQMPKIKMCDIPYHDLPLFTRIQSTLDEVTTYESWPSEIFNTPNGETVNIFLKRLDEFLHACEVSRQQKETWETFKAGKMRPKFASQGDEEILLTIAQLAQDRAHIINYVIAHRISPVFHQNHVNEAGRKNTPYNSAEIVADVHLFAREVIRMFWGEEQGQNPLPQRWDGDFSISNYHGWADRIDDKLAAMAGEDAEALRYMFWWSRNIPPRQPKLYRGNDRDDDGRAAGKNDTDDKHIQVLVSPLGHLYL
ncbi:hypothetical protein F4818DRAFT_453883 [Hypoxylon cercidicola]|nr:hypothetical protein F4818DRAFT_453883 [Hypoxylon cercidicola]